jgi:hypothetical protein
VNRGARGAFSGFHLPESRASQGGQFPLIATKFANAPTSGAKGANTKKVPIILVVQLSFEQAGSTRADYDCSHESESEALFR